MQLIYENKQKRIIRDKEDISFSSFSSYHLIAVTARVRSEKQLGQNATDDEDLTVKLDEKKIFPRFNSDKLIDSPAAFSGGRLYNLAKTVYFLTFLKGKNHTIILKTDNPSRTATFESFQIYTLGLNQRLSLEPKLQAEDGDRRPWITFALDTIPLRSIATTITYSRRKRDSDDVKIKIDGKTQGNVLANIQHFLWRFAGSFLPWSSPIKTKTETFMVYLPQGLHYIEFDADRMPILENVVFDFGQELLIPKGVPTIDDPKWTGDFYDDTEVVLLSRTIYGEAGGESKEAKVAVGWAIRNRLEDSKKRWGDTHHDVILKPFQYQPFNDPNSKVFKKITDPALDNPIENKGWHESYEVAKAVIDSREADPTQGANHFYSKNAQNVPSWADENKFTVEIGNTRFYKI